MDNAALRFTAALSLLMSATAYSANIPISYLPFKIMAPGTYDVMANLICPAQAAVAIAIASNISGPVILDLQGHTLTGPNTSPDSVGVSIGGTRTNNNYPITVRNGTITNFYASAVSAFSGSIHAFDSYLSNINLYNLVFDSGGVRFSYVNTSKISNCIFKWNGITDNQSHGGNRYINDTFIGAGEALSITCEDLLTPPEPTIVLQNCYFQPLGEEIPIK